MAFGFIKKMFSFGKKEEPAPVDVPAIEAAVTEEVIDVPAFEAVADEVQTFEPEAIVETVAPEIIAPQIKQPVIAKVKNEKPKAIQPEEPKPLPVEIELKPESPKPEATKSKVTKPEPQKLSVGKTVEAVAAPVETAPLPKASWFQRLKAGLSRSSRDLSDSITGIFTKRKLDEDTLQDLEDVLIRADLGLETAMRINTSSKSCSVSSSNLRLVKMPVMESDNSRDDRDSPAFRRWYHEAFGRGGVSTGAATASTVLPTLSFCGSGLVSSGFGGSGFGSILGGSGVGSTG